MSRSAKVIPSPDHLRECFRYEQGSLIWRDRPSSHFRNERTAAMWRAKFSGRPAGRAMVDGSGYVQIGLDGKRYLAHRLIAAMHGIDTSGVVDHINGNPTDNRVENLRGCSQRQNCMNNRGWAGKEEPVGVSRLKNGRYAAYIRLHGRHKHLGHFSTLVGAVKARLSAELTHYTGFSRAQSVCAERGVTIDEAAEA